MMTFSRRGALWAAAAETKTTIISQRNEFAMKKRRLEITF
jgi:hypothetical protein